MSCFYEVSICTENAAFDEDMGARELSRILRKIAQALDEDIYIASSTPYAILDIDGNHVGDAKLVVKRQQEATS